MCSTNSEEVDFRSSSIKNRPLATSERMRSTTSIDVIIIARVMVEKAEIISNRQMIVSSSFYRLPHVK